MNKKSLAFTFGGIIATALTAPIAHSDSNPFGMKTIGSVMVVAEADTTGEKVQEGKCGEGKCGAKKAKMEAAGASNGKTVEGKCGAGKAGADKMKEGSCGGEKK